MGAVSSMGIQWDVSNCGDDLELHASDEGLTLWCPTHGLIEMRDDLPTVSEVMSATMDHHGGRVVVRASTGRPEGFVSYSCPTLNDPDVTPLP